MQVFFETFGVPRVLEVEDRTSDAGARVVREKADGSDIGSVGAPMAGDILEVRNCCALQAVCNGFCDCSAALTLHRADVEPRTCICRAVQVELQAAACRRACVRACLTPLSHC